MKRWPVKDFEGLYEVDEYSEVYSVHRRIECKNGVIKHFQPVHLSKHANVQVKYFQVQLYKNNKQYTKYNHILGATAFVANPDNLPEVNHEDGDRQNNHYTNFNWVTSSGNSQHAVDTGLRTYTNRLSYSEFLECLQAIIGGENYASLSARVPYKVPFLSTKIRKIARAENLEHLLDASLRDQKQMRARINGNKNR